MSNQNVTPLGRKIVVAILGTTLLALVLAFLLNIVPMVYAYRQDATDKARAQADLMSNSLVASIDFDDPVSAQESLATLSLIPSVTGAVVYAGEGNVFATYGTEPVFKPIEGAVVEAGFSRLFIVTPIPAESPASFLVLEVSLDGQWRLLKGYLLTGLAVMIAVFLVTLKVAGFFRRRLGDPVAELTTFVHDISQEKDYSRRVRHASNDEVGVLVSEFNLMLERIEHRDNQLRRHRELLEEKVEERTLQLRKKQLELLRNNRLLMSEIKKRAQAEMIREEVERINRHDLKSSLSLIIGYPELLLNEGDLSSDQEKMVRRIRAAGYRMLDMIRNHLNMFKMENGIYALNNNPVDVVEILCSLEEEFAPLLAGLGVQLGIELDGNEVIGDEEFVVVGEAPLIRTMLRNLLQNAIEASTTGDKVLVVLRGGDKQSVVVSNPAPIPEEIRQRFFDKYVTHGKENGTGLGTYIVALIAKTHGANVIMKTDESHGTIMTIRFRESRAGHGLLQQLSSQ